jgi:hypothetical protein
MAEFMKVKPAVVAFRLFRLLAHPRATTSLFIYLLPLLVVAWWWDQFIGIYVYDCILTLTHNASPPAGMTL